MKLFLSLLLTATVFLASPQKSFAQNYAALFEQFQPSALTREDKRFLQAALAFEGHYKGLFDGDWGKLSQRAMENYSARTFQTAVEPWHMALLAFSLFDEMKENAWDMYHSDWLGMTYLWPAGAFHKDRATENFINFRHTRSSLSYSIGVLDHKTAQNVHDFTQRRHAGSGEAYSVRKTNFAISTA